jgi:hypothetical protein
MQITKYWTIIDQTWTDLLKSYRIEIKSNWQKSLIEQTEFNLILNWTLNELRIMNFFTL